MEIICERDTFNGTASVPCSMTGFGIISVEPVVYVITACLH